MIFQLLKSDDEDVLRVREAFDWYVYPSVNPDGYEFTQTVRRIIIVN